MLSRIKRFFRSLRFGIFAAVFLAVMVPTVAVSVISLAVYEKRSVSTDISSLTGQAKLLNNQIVSTGFMADPSLSFLNAELTALGNAYEQNIHEFLLRERNIDIPIETINEFIGKYLPK